MALQEPFGCRAPSVVRLDCGQPSPGSFSCADRDRDWRGCGHLRSWPCTEGRRRTRAAAFCDLASAPEQQHIPARIRHLLVW